MVIDQMAVDQMVIVQLTLHQCRYAKCYDAKCHYAKCHYAKCHYAKCYFTKCGGAKPTVDVGLFYQLLIYNFYDRKYGKSARVFRTQMLTNFLTMHKPLTSIPGSIQ
jgi:hypothetical protein